MHIIHASVDLVPILCVFDHCVWDLLWPKCVYQAFEQMVFRLVHVLCSRNGSYMFKSRDIIKSHYVRRSECHVTQARAQVTFASHHTTRSIDTFPTAIDSVHKMVRERVKGILSDLTPPDDIKDIIPKDPSNDQTPKDSARDDAWKKVGAEAQRTLQALRASAESELAAPADIDQPRRLAFQDQLLRAIKMANEDIQNTQTELGGWQKCVKQVHKRMWEYYQVLDKVRQVIEEQPQQDGSSGQGDKDDRSEEIGRLQAQIGELQETDKTSKEEIETLKGEIKTLKAEKEALKADTKNVANSENKKSVEKNDDDNQSAAAESQDHGSSTAPVPTKRDIGTLKRFHGQVWRLVQEFFENRTVDYNPDDENEAFAHMLMQFETVLHMSNRLCVLQLQDKEGVMKNTLSWELDGLRDPVRSIVGRQWGKVHRDIFAKLKGSDEQALQDMLDESYVEAKKLRDKGTTSEHIHIKKAVSWILSWVGIEIEPEWDSESDEETITKDGAA